MAKARITHQWSDGDVLVVELSLTPSYPDAVAEVKAQTLALYRDALAVTVETLAPDVVDEQ